LLGRQQNKKGGPMALPFMVRGTHPPWRAVPALHK
jgi:hypothetical protein